MGSKEEITLEKNREVGGDYRVFAVKIPFKPQPQQ